MATPNQMSSFLNADRLSSATRLSKRASTARYEKSVKTTRPARVATTESGPENTPNEDQRIPSDWWICTDPPGPSEEWIALHIDPAPFKVTVDRSNWKEYGYTAAPSKYNYRHVGAILSRHKVPIGVVSETEILEDWASGVTSHIYTILLSGEVKGT
jgi:hypothetical protein